MIFFSFVFIPNQPYNYLKKGKVEKIGIEWKAIWEGKRKIN